VSISSQRSRLTRLQPGVVDVVVDFSRSVGGVGVNLESCPAAVVYEYQCGADEYTVRVLASGGCARSGVPSIEIDRVGFARRIAFGRPRLAHLMAVVMAMSTSTYCSEPANAPSASVATLAVQGGQPGP
jgi:hypothetical protein